MKGFHTQSGQILPLLTIVISLITAIGLSLTQFLFTSAQSLKSAEELFQKSVTNHQKTAYTLNAIAENNSRIAVTISAMTHLFLEGTARALDLAASTPVWEQRLPIPVPEDVFRSFDTALIKVRPMIERLNNQNKAFLRALPESVQPFLEQLSMEKTLCALQPESKTFTKSGGGCLLSAKTSFFALPHLRQIRGLKALSQTLGPDAGLLLMNFKGEFFLETYSSEPKDKDFPDPFNNLRLHLTHPFFCRSAVTAARRRCPVDNRKDASSVEQLMPLSLKPHWSVLIDEPRDTL
jgi:hypothetical protein